MKNRILFVDDDLGNLTSTTELLELWGYEVKACQSAAQALELLESGKRFMITLLDYHLGGDTNGAALAAKTKEIDPFTIVMIYSCDSTVKPVLEAMRAGAINFIDKNEDTDLLKESLERAGRLFEESFGTLNEETTLVENAKLIASIDLIGQSRELAGVVRQTLRFRDLNENLLILGETGVGKERIARALHRGGDSTFFPVNCSGFTEGTMVESQLFGHEKGSFTGAVDRKVGIFEAARNGTVFLDEIHHLPVTVQPVLLRALRERTIRRLGGRDTIPIHCRIIAAAKPFIQEQSDKSDFLPDLFTRLNELSISIPSLKHRKLDIRPLTDHFLAQFNEKYRASKRFSPGVYEAFLNYSWNANVAELSNMVRKLVLNTHGTRVMTDDLPPELQNAIGHSSEDVSLKEFEERQLKEKRRFLSEIASTSKSMRHAARRLRTPSTTVYDQFRLYGVKVPEKSSAS